MSTGSRPDGSLAGRCCGDLGMAGGFEMMAFGLLVFVGGTLLVANAWAAVDLKLALGAASRDAARAYVEAPDEASAATRADEAARAALLGQGRDPTSLHALSIEPEDGSFGRCGRVVVRASYPLAAVTVPWIGGIGDGIVIQASNSEIVDPYRSDLPGASRCP